ncbi:MAG: response regulator [Bacteroidia bacterium]|nr:response regulator [Bacteroidia bacterium]
MEPYKPKVLIVDDNPMNVQVLTDSLDGLPYEVLVAMNGERAIKIAERMSPDVVLLDVNLPGMNGYEVCKTLKSNELTRNLPVLFLSALNDSESKVHGFSVGGVDFISKPFNKDEVIARLDTHLKIARLTHELQEKNKHLEEARHKLQESNQMLLDSIIYSKRIQNAIFKTETELASFFPQSFILFRPQHHVSGDFYWFHERRNKLFLVVGDCTGHGVPGAMLSILAMQLFIRVVEERGIMEPAEALNEVDFELKKVLKQDYHSSSATIHDGMDVIAVCMDLNHKNLKYASANRPLIKISKGEFTKLSGEKYPLGGDQFQHKNFISRPVEIETGDMFYMNSDGYADQFGGPLNQKFKSRKFYDLLIQISSNPEKEQKEHLFQAFDQWKNTREQTDDVLVLGFRI